MSDETGELRNGDRSLSQRYALVAHDLSGGKRDRDAAGDHCNLDEAEFSGAPRASFDETPKPAF